MNPALTRRDLLTAAALTLAGLASRRAASAAAAVPRVGPISILINDSPWYGGFEKLVQLYQQTTGNQVKLAVTPFTGMLEQTRNTVTGPESTFDIVNLNEAWYATFYAGGFVSPIKSIDPSFQLDPNIIEYVYSTRWDFQKKYSTPDGALLGLPINGNIQALYYRADLFQQAGLKPPETWNDVAAAAKRFHNPPNMYGFAQRGQRAGWSCGFDWFAFLRAYKSDWVANPPADWTVTIDSAAAKASLAECDDLLKSYGPPNLAGLGNAELTQLLASGKLAMASAVIATFPTLDDPQSSAVVNKFNVTVMPRAANGVHATTSGIWVMSIPHNLPDARKKAALTFLQWALTKDAQIQYTKFGAIPVRQDVYKSDLAYQPQFRWMKAMAASTPYIHENVRIPEGPQITDSIELHVNQLYAGQMSVDQSADAMAQDIYGILQKGGYPTKRA